MFLKLEPGMKKYIQEAKDTRKPSLASWQTLQTAFKDDPMLRAKVAFFVSVANEVKPFLRKFQSSKPLAPFLYEEIFQVTKSLLKRIAKPEIINNLKSAAALSNLNLQDSENLLPAKKVEIGLATQQENNKLLQLKSKNQKVTEKEVLKFRQQCLDFIRGMILKIAERSPLKFPVVKAISCLDPVIISHREQIANTRMSKLLGILLEDRWIDEYTAERCQKQFKEVIALSKTSLKDAFSIWDERNDSLDNFYSSILIPKHFPTRGTDDLAVLISKVLTLSHGNADVESGFSVNESLMVENLKEESLINLRIVDVSIAYHGKVKNVPVSKKMLQDCRLARSRYRQTLEDQRKKLQAENLSEKEKNVIKEKLREIDRQMKNTAHRAADELDQLNKQKKLLEERARRL